MTIQKYYDKIYNRIMYGNNYKPLGFNAWSGQYLSGVNEAAQVLSDPIFESKEYDGKFLDQYKEVAMSALLNELAYRTSRNQRDHLDIAYENPEQEKRFLEGNITPSEGIKLLHEQPHVSSIELARLRHVGDWNGPAKVVEAVRRDLITDQEILDSTIDVSTVSPSYYRITKYDVADPKFQQMLGVTRKKEIFSNFNDEIVSVLAETYVLDVSSDSLDEGCKKKIIEEFELLEHLRQTNPAEADKWHELHHNFVGFAIDSLAKQRRRQKMPESYEDRSKLAISGALPLTSVVYAASRKTRRDYRDRIESREHES